MSLASIIGYVLNFLFLVYLMLYFFIAGATEDTNRDLPGIPVSISPFRDMLLLLIVCLVFLAIPYAFFIAVIILTIIFVIKGCYSSPQ